MYVVKRNGEVEPFTEEKVVNTMQRVGVPPTLQAEVLAHVRERFQGEYISTDELFKHVFEFLKKNDKKSSLRLNLRRAIFDLGPTGFPFERYLARIFQDQGYKTLVDAHMMGDCVMHEIDVLLEKEGRREIIEAKFHNDLGSKTDVHVALYTHARFLDVSKKNNIHNVWVITNTKLTSDAIAYAMCKGIKILAWNFPSGENLQHFVEIPKMYPITILTDLTHEEKYRLIEDNIILCRDLLSLTPQEISSFPQVKRSHLERAIKSTRILLEQ